MWHVIAAASTSLFSGGRTLKLIKNGVNVTTSANTLVLTKNITLTVIDCCAPSPIRLAAPCIGASAFIVASMESLDTVTIGSAIHLISKIYENC